MDRELKKLDTRDIRDIARDLDKKTETKPNPQPVKLPDKPVLNSSTTFLEELTASLRTFLRRYISGEESTGGVFALMSGMKPPYLIALGIVLVGSLLLSKC